MNDIDLTPELLKRYGEKRLTIGRYSVSGIYAIFAGWTKPEDFFIPSKNDFTGIKRMWAGTINHDFIESMLPKDKCEIKVEYKYKDIVIVGKADYLPNDDEVWDFKTSDTIMDKSKPWANHQIKMYCSMFKREQGLLFQPVINNEKFILKHIGTVKRDDEWFMGQCEKLYKFHEKLLELKELNT